MANKLLLRPVYLIGHLRQKRSTAISLTDIDAMTVQLKLIQTMDASHGCKYRNFNINILQFLLADRHETRVFKGRCTRHLSHDLEQRHILTKVSDTATKSPMLMQRHECAAL